MNIGVCGTGNIASWVSSFINQINDENIVLYACAGRTQANTQAFADKFGWKKVYTDYDSLMADPEVDVIYVAVPNTFHYDLCMKAIEADKGVICEKPFAMNYRETREIIEKAEEKGVFLSEALWPSFLPIRKLVRDEIEAGTIGEVVAGEITQWDNLTFLPRVMDFKLGGGALLDEGPYAVGATTDYFGTEIESVTASVRKFKTGVDADSHYDIVYKNGVKVHVHQTMDYPNDQHLNNVMIIGTKGKISMNAVSNPTECKVYDEYGKPIKSIEIPPQLKNQGMPPVAGYEHEWIAFEKAFREGKTETEEVPHAKSLAIARVLAEVRTQGGVIFPAEGELF